MAQPKHKAIVKISFPTEKDYTAYLKKNWLRYYENTYLNLARKYDQENNTGGKFEKMAKAKLDYDRDNW